jgi:PTS system mannose-specific IIB component/fructoselysine and glucoselysine-specific PTS system IIB component
MAIALYRVDERLIHGQVVVGWGALLHPHCIVVVDDALAASTWEQELYTLGLSPDIRAQFTTVADARAHLDEWRAAADLRILLTRDVATMKQLAEGGALKGEEINIGGIHHAPGRREVLTYVFLSDAEAEHLKALEREGVQVYARDLPGSRRIPLEQLLSGEARA